MPRETFLNYEYYHIRGQPNPLSNDVMKNPVEWFDDGYIEVPKGPGLGIELNEKIARKYALPH
jgi:L-alanine-DL-glutamate epimerase-like enolase superfamily enzyme